MELKIEYEFGKYLEFESHDINYFIGSNYQLKWKLYRSFQRFSTGKILSDLEENVYGDDGINFFYDQKVLNAKKMLIHFLDSRESILSACQFSKGSLIYNQLEDYENNFEIMKLLDLINDDILKLEISFQQSFEKNGFHAIKPTFSPLTYSGFLKNSLELQYLEKDEPYPLSMMDVGYLLDEYCNLLFSEIQRTQKECWIVINKPEYFLHDQLLQKLLQKFKDIGKETNLLKVFWISDYYLDEDFSVDDIEKVIFLGERAEQFPPYETLKQSIRLRYPDEFKLTDNELLNSLHRIIPRISENQDLLHLPLKDMVLLKVINQLMGYLDTQYSINYDNLSELEYKFLAD
ncbi:CRISPR-associated protein Csn2-St [Enterococcus sp. CWB-B31]|uniref:CRISPR-associated protein Csn2-St n=1 Tax=Enterococcus sp. CWB-B31 TaxID=2885159 RepID=UPI001E46009A|nr:CRISPR-associated protein Csn2-St [Enterococcus sp. CWB-B31]MCB5955769.1 hypothetical protein [Enterococcus sp. CWB-B31]